ncbi:Nck-associated protein 1, partial [Phlyctochytrium arcticum]
DINRWADHILSLHTHAQGLLTALYCAKHSLQPDNAATPTIDLLSKGGTPETTYSCNGSYLTPVSPSRPAMDRVRCITEPALADVNKKLMKKFPELADFTKSRATAFRDMHLQILEELRSYYTLLIAAMDFVEISSALLQESVNLVQLSFEVNPDLANAFLDLLVDHVSVVYMTTALGADRKLIAALFCKAWQIHSGEPERNFQRYRFSSYGWCTQCLTGLLLRLAKFLNHYDKPLPVMQENLSNLSSRILGLVLEMKPDLDSRLCMTADNLRKMAVLSLTPEMSGIKAPEADEKHLRGLTQMNRQHSVITIAFLIAPSEISKQLSSVDILKQALTYGYSLPLVRNEMLNLITEFEHSSKAHKKIPVMKSLVSESLTAAALSAPNFHRDRRDYLRHQLKQMVCLSGDNRILCTKFPIIASALGFARNEIMWYFHHLDVDINGRRKGKKDTRVIDVGVVELIGLVKELGRNLRRNMDVIRDHFANQISSFYSPNLLQLLDNAIGPDIEQEPMGILLNELHRLLTMFTNDEMGELLDGNGLEAIRMNWLRFQVTAALPSAGGVPNATDIAWLMGDLCERSRWLDQFSASLDSLCSLKELCFYQSALHEHLAECFDSAQELIRHSGAFGILAEEFLTNISPAWPAEQKHLTVHSILFATEIYSVLGQYAAIVAHDIAMHMVTNEHQTLTQEAAAALWRSHGTDRNKKKKKQPTEKALKPGWESSLAGMEPSTRSLERQKQLVRNLLLALTSPITTVVYDSEFHPFEFFLESFAERFHGNLSQGIFRPSENASPTGFLGSSGPHEEGLSFDIKRPSTMLLEIRAYMSAVRFLENLVPVSCMSAIKEALLSQLNPVSAREYADSQPDQMVYAVGAKKTREKNKPPMIGTNQSILVLYMAWYSELIGSRAVSGTVHFSPNRSVFVSRSTGTFQAETYTDLGELCALCQIVGPHGIRFIDEQLTRMIAALMQQTKEQLIQHQEYLEKLRTYWADESRCLEVLKKFRNMKEHTAKPIQMGFILEFRLLLAQAVRKVFGDACPIIYTCVETAQGHYPSSLGGQRPYKVIDLMANDIGIVSRVDMRLRAALTHVMGQTSDAGLWQLLPYLYATYLWHTTFDESASYNPALGGLDNNGHVMATTFASVLSGMAVAMGSAGAGATGVLTGGTVRGGPGGGVGLVVHHEKEFLVVASTILMRLSDRKVTEKDLQERNLLSAFWILKKVGVWVHH